MSQDKTMELFKALGDKTRLDIVRALYNKTLCLEELSEHFGLTAATLSFHMKKLEEAGLVTKKREQYFTNFTLAGAVYEKKLRDLINPENSEVDSEIKFREKVISTFMQKGKIAQFPRQHKKRLVLLNEVTNRFEIGKIYDETEVDKIIEKVYPDYCTLRRMMIDEGLMERNKGKYKLTVKRLTNNQLEQNMVNNTKERRQELKQQYRETKVVRGVYKIESKANSKIYIGCSQNIQSRFNRYQFELNLGLNTNPDLQQDWNKYGSDNFTFEILEEIKEKTAPGRDARIELEKLKEKWLEKLYPFGEKGYNTKSAPMN